MRQRGEEKMQECVSVRWPFPSTCLRGTEKPRLHSPGSSLRSSITKKRAKGKKTMPHPPSLVRSVDTDNVDWETSSHWWHRASAMCPGSGRERSIQEHSRNFLVLRHFHGHWPRPWGFLLRDPYSKMESQAWMETRQQKST